MWPDVLLIGGLALIPTVLQLCKWWQGVEAKWVELHERGYRVYERAADSSVFLIQFCKTAQEAYQTAKAFADDWHTISDVRIYYDTREHTRTGELVIADYHDEIRYVATTTDDKEMPLRHV